MSCLTGEQKLVPVTAQIRATVTKHPVILYAVRSSNRSILSCVGWESHNIAVDELKSWDEAHAVAALGGASAARQAVAQCTLSGYLIGDAVGKAHAPVSQAEVLGLTTDEVGVGVAGNKCWTAATRG